MAICRRVFVSTPADQFNAKPLNALKWGLIGLIQKRGLFPEIFFNPKTTEGFAASVSWTPDAAERVLRHCVGAVLMGLPRWRFPNQKGNIMMSTEYCQYEGAIARTLSLPLLVFIQDGVLRRGVFDNSFGPFIATIPRDADASWLKSEVCRIAVNKWLTQIDKRRDIFLGYCSSSTKLAKKIKNFIISDTGATVLDWQTDFAMARTVLEEISEAGSRCNAGIFLFTRDDMVSTSEPKKRVQSKRSLFQSQGSAIPRDNVVFEAGYFMSLKGPGRVLIVLEEGTKMPADLGGQIYTLLKDRSDITPIKNDLRRFVDRL